MTRPSRTFALLEEKPNAGMDTIPPMASALLPRRLDSAAGALVTATVSGSFHRHMDQVDQAVKELEGRGVKVLSPSQAHVVDARGPFLFVESDQFRSVRMTEDRHLESIKQSSFVLLICTDGYVGSSAAFELGFAIAFGVPIFSLGIPSDQTLRQYVTPVASVAKVIQFMSVRRALRPNLLLEPETALDTAEEELQAIRRLFEAKPNLIGDEAGWQVYRHWSKAYQALTPPAGF